MTITVFKTPFISYRDYTDTRMFFDLNGQDYQYVDYQHADIMLLDHQTPHDLEYNTTNIKLFLDIFSNMENQISCINFRYSLIPTEYNKNCYTITNVIDTVTDRSHTILFNDFLFNRTKAYYLNYQFNTTTTKWYFEDATNFIIPEVTPAEYKTNIYVAPNNTHLSQPHRPIKYRPQLVRLLRENYLTDGYIGNPDDSALLLYPHKIAPNCNNVTELHQIEYTDSRTFSYSPPHNLYYKDTFISIYGETIEFGPGIAVTEKTYDPLIKGHFILPFSTHGFIAHLRTLGFKFPNFINYDYDLAIDDDTRYNLYSDEIHRLLRMNIDEWRQLWNNNIDIVKYNQQLFYTKPYDRIDITQFF